MARKKAQNNVIGTISNAVAEVNEARERMESGGCRDEVNGEAIVARYRQVMDEAEQAIAQEYKQSGSLTSAKMCEINSGMDEYALSVQSVLKLIERLEQEGEG